MAKRKGQSTVDLPEVEHDPLYEIKGSPETNTEPPPPQQVAMQPVDDTSPTAVDIPDMIEAQPREEPRVRPPEYDHKDLFKGAIKMAFIGGGQGGGRIISSFYEMGYRKVCCVNTTNQDLVSLPIPDRCKMVIGNNRGGAGKDPEEGRLAAKESFEDIMDLLMRTWGEEVEMCFISVGAGGGSGSGSWPVLVDAVQEYCKSTNVEKPYYKHIGIIMTMPKRSEGARVQRNAAISLRKATDMVEKGRISCLILVDNAKIHELFPRLPVKRFWAVANRNFAAVLHTFNILAAQNSEFNTFDCADFRSVIRNGIMIFGMTRVDRYSQKEDISQAVRQNLKNTLLADGFDLSTATIAGAIVVAHDTILSEIPMENIDYAFNALGRTLGNEGITLHNGIYEGRQTGMRVFTIISGLHPPESRLAELEQLAK